MAQNSLFALANKRFETLRVSKLLVGLDGLEPSTSRLSGARSNHLSYRPFHSSWVRSLPSALLPGYRSPSGPDRHPVPKSGNAAGGDDGNQNPKPLRGF